jgi:hypothetical protein
MLNEIFQWFVLFCTDDTDDLDVIRGICRMRVCIYSLGGRVHEGGGRLGERAKSEAGRMQSSRIYTQYRNVADLTVFVGAYSLRRSFLTV